MTTAMTKGGGLKVAVRGEREIIMTRLFDAPRELMFAAFTVPELVQRWLLGPPGWMMPVCEIDLRVGGRYRYLWRNMEGIEMGVSGAFREIQPPTGSCTPRISMNPGTRANPPSPPNSPARAARRC